MIMTDNAMMNCCICYVKLHIIGCIVQQRNLMLLGDRIDWKRRLSMRGSLTVHFVRERIVWRTFRFCADESNVRLVTLLLRSLDRLLRDYNLY